MSDPKIIKMPVDELVPYENNPRNNDKAVDAVKNSIDEFGFLVPILVDKKNNIVAGHTRYKAAQDLGLKEVPVIVLDNLSEDELRKYRLVDNKSGGLSSWDYELLQEELESIDEIDMSAFEFGYAGTEDEQTDKREGTNLDEGSELDLGDFSDEVFENECPYCGFRWNE